MKTGSIFGQHWIYKKTEEYLLDVEGVSIKISNPHKVFFPELNITKLDLINYYLRISDKILPYIRNRPQNLHRHPDGIYGEHFYHKDTDFKESPLKTVAVFSQEEQKIINYPVCTDKAGMIYLINLGCIELNHWLSKLPDIDRPDILVFDLDPGENTSFDLVKKTAIIVKELFDEMGVNLFLKTTGASGIHLLVPLKNIFSFESSRLFAEIVANYIAKKADFISIDRNPSTRKDKVYFDFLQNRHGQTIASVYSVRPNKQALVSMPLSWSKLDNAKPDSFNIFNVPSRRDTDPWQDFYKKSYSIDDLLKRIQKLINSE